MDVNDFLPTPGLQGMGVGVLLLGELHSHCILVLLSLNLQAAHSSVLLEYTSFLFFSSFVLCGVSVFVFTRLGSNSRPYAS